MLLLSFSLQAPEGLGDADLQRAKGISFSRVYLMLKPLSGILSGITIDFFKRGNGVKIQRRYIINSREVISSVIQTIFYLSGNCLSGITILMVSLEDAYADLSFIN